MATTRIDIEGSASGFLAAAKQAEAALGRLTNLANTTTKNLGSISKSADSVAKSAEGMGRALQLALGAMAGSSLFNFVDGLQNMQNKLRVATSSEQEFGQAMTYIKAIADKTGQSLNAIGDLYSKVSMNASKLGYDTAQVATVTNAFATALQVSGASAQGSASSIYQFSQILAKGKVNGDEFTTIMENLGGPVMDLIAKNMGLTTAELVKLKEKGLIGAKDFTDALIRSMDQLAVMGGKIAPTVGQALQRIQNGFAMFLLELEKSTGVFNKVANGMDYLAKNIDAVVFSAAVMATVFAVGRFLVIAREVQVLAASMGVLNAVMATISKSPIILLLTGIAAFASYMSAKSLFGDAPKDAAELAKAAAEANKNNSKMPGQLTGVSDKYKDILKDLKEQLAISGYIGDEHKIQAQMLQYKKQLEGQITAEQSKQLEGILRQIDANQKLAEMRKAVRDFSVPKTGVESGIQAAGQLGNLDPINAELTAYATLNNGLEALRLDNQLSEAQYYAYREEAARQHGEKMNALRLTAFENELKAAGVVNTEIINVAKTTMQQAQMVTQGGIVGIQGAIGMLGGFLEQAGKQNKKAFEAQKAVAIAQTIISTYQAATQAFASMSAIPFIGPALGFAAAATIVAAGMANVAQIRNQQYSGRALGGPVMGGQSYIVGENGPEMFTPNTTGSITRNSDLGNQGPVNINFQITAVDAAGIDDLLVQRRGMITQFVRDAMQEQGQRSKM